MNLEQLTKHQIVLLTLLVSFVTSIATGIVTVSLLGQAPPGVTKTINQIVEHTVETVVPSAPNQTSTVKTVVVKNDDLAATSIASAQKAIVRIVAKGSDQLVARGIIIDNKGTAVTDGAALADSGAADFEAILQDGERVPVMLPKIVATSTPLLAVRVTVGTSTAFSPAAITDQSKLQLGQSVIRIGGTGTDVVGEGVIAALPAKDSNEVDTTVSASTPGSVLITLFGEIIGITTTQSLGDGGDFYTTLQAPAAAPASPSATKSSSQT
ncbi:MAG: hypothetical protein KGH79_03865 [Patescibacteria group bacterium]|nr:hypothetical protein [Patescibacteria group bacterium]